MSTHTVANTGPFMTTREACKRFAFSRPDSLLRSWRAAGLPVYHGGNLLLAVSDFPRFVGPEVAPSGTGG